MSKIIFGTDGWRGLLHSEINEQTTMLVAQAFADYIGVNFESPSVVIGYDGRTNSDVFANLFALVLASNGIYTELSDRVVPTPFVSFRVKDKKLSAGVMITASHNPAEYNGIKFKAQNGGPFSTETTKQVEDLLGKNKVVTTGGNYHLVDLWCDYKKHLNSLIDFAAIKNCGISIAVDSMSGSGGMFLHELLDSHGIPVQTIFGNPKEDFSGRLAEPIEKNLAPLSDFLQSNSFSLGLATDGDADRLGIMTDKGEWMNIQETILYLAQYYIKDRGVRGGIVKTSSVSEKLATLVNKDDIHSVQVGFKYVSEAMENYDAAFGAEESGGFGFKEHIPERDGIFSGLVFVEMLAKSSYKNLSSFIEHKRKELGLISYSRIDFHESRLGRIDMPKKMVAANLREIAGYQVSTCELHYSSRGVINSLKYYLIGKSRWLLIRTSETEPMVRIYAEGESENEVSRILYEGKKLVESFII